MADRWVVESAAGEPLGGGNPFDGVLLDGKQIYLVFVFLK